MFSLLLVAFSKALFGTQVSAGFCCIFPAQNKTPENTSGLFGGWVLPGLRIRKRPDTRRVGVYSRRSSPLASWRGGASDVRARDCIFFPSRHSRRRQRQRILRPAAPTGSKVDESFLTSSFRPQPSLPTSSASSVYGATTADELLPPPPFLAKLTISPISSYIPRPLLF